MGFRNQGGVDDALLNKNQSIYKTRGRVNGKNSEVEEVEGGGKQSEENEWKR